MKISILSILTLLCSFAVYGDEPFYGNFYDPDYAIITPDDFVGVANESQYTIEYEGETCNELSIEKTPDGRVLLHNNSVYYREIVTNSVYSLPIPKYDSNAQRFQRPTEPKQTRTPNSVPPTSNPPPVEPPPIDPPPVDPPDDTPCNHPECEKPPCERPSCDHVKPPKEHKPHHTNHSGGGDDTNPAGHGNENGFENPHNGGNNHGNNGNHGNEHTKPDHYSKTCNPLKFKCPPVKVPNCKPPHIHIPKCEVPKPKCETPRPSCPKIDVPKPPKVHINHSGHHDGTNPSGRPHHDNGGINNPHH